MLEASNLFGHERGAFTGANCRCKPAVPRQHRRHAAADEIAELPLPLQAKMLRVLQEREVLPIGAIRPEKGRRDHRRCQPIRIWRPTSGRASR
jgi:two-component system response regulator FlrC